MRRPWVAAWVAVVVVTVACLVGSAVRPSPGDRSETQYILTVLPDYGYDRPPTLNPVTHELFGPQGEPLGTLEHPAAPTRQPTPRVLTEAEKQANLAAVARAMEEAKARAAAVATPTPIATTTAAPVLPEAAVTQTVRTPTGRSVVYLEAQGSPGGPAGGCPVLVGEGMLGICTGSSVLDVTVSVRVGPREEHDGAAVVYDGMVLLPSGRVGLVDGDTSTTALDDIRPSAGWHRVVVEVAGRDRVAAAQDAFMKSLDKDFNPTDPALELSPEQVYVTFP